MIIFSNVTKQFGNDTYGLVDVSFGVNRGELVLITGHSGSGKTTLMRLLTKEYSPSQGDIYFENTPLSDIKFSQVHHHRRKIGVVFQDYKLLSDHNVWENIALPLYIIGKSQDEIESRVTDLLKLVNLVDKAFLFPSQLSGGEAQRVSIARALATGPSVIFADEPTGNLDPETSASIAKLLHKINELGTTVLLATHDIGVIQSLPATRRIHLDKGRIMQDTSSSGEAVTPPTSVPSSTSEKTTDNQKADTTTEIKVENLDDETPTPQPSTPKRSPRVKFKLPSFKLPFMSPKKASEPELKAEPEVVVPVPNLPAAETITVEVENLELATSTSESDQKPELTDKDQDADTDKEDHHKKSSKKSKK